MHYQCIAIGDLQNRTVRWTNLRVQQLAGDNLLPIDRAAGGEFQFQLRAGCMRRSWHLNSLRVLVQSDIHFSSGKRQRRQANLAIS